MAKLLATIKAIITRLLFSCHGLIAIWQVTQYKRDPIYWSLCTPIALLFFEGLFTLCIKETQEWRWFCPSVFLYLGSVVPAIWLLELDKLERRHKIQEETFNLAEATGDLKNLNKLLGLGVNIKIPNIQMNAEMWVTLIEQFLMLILIVGRWMLPKGDLTRDQLSQLLLVYIGTAADIIEFFDSFKDNTIANEPILVFLTLGIWSWSLLQFTIVLTATRSRKPRGTTAHAHADEEEELNTCCKNCCCSIDVWGIALNILLQDAPFLTFRLLIIIHYRIISYMNVFFTCKNTLVILLQIYRLFVVQAENKKHGNSKKKIDRNHEKQMRRNNRRQHSEDIFIISNEKYDRIRADRDRSKTKRKKAVKKDTGYSTESPEVPRRRRDKDKEESKKAKIYDKKKSRKEEKESSKKARKKEKKKKQDSTEESEDSRDQRRTKRESCIEEESDTSSSSEMPIKKRSSKNKKKSTTESSESSTSSS